jgi:hypothetical protein
LNPAVPVTRTTDTEAELDFSKLRTGEIVAPLSGIALFVILFLDWVGAEDSDEGLSGWDYLGGDVTGFLVFLAIGLSVTLGVLAAADRRNPIGSWPWGGPTAALGLLAFDIVLWRFFTVPEGGELGVGLFLGLLAAAGIAAGGYLTLREGGIDPLGIGGGSSTATTRQATTRETSSASSRRVAKKKPAAKRKAAAKRRAAR